MNSLERTAWIRDMYQKPSVVLVSPLVHASWPGTFFGGACMADKKAFNRPSICYSVEP